MILPRRWSGCTPGIELVLLFLRTSSFFASAFLAPRCQSLGTVHLPGSAPLLVFGTSGDDDENYDDEDTPIIKPYRNRSLAWTLRYRKVNPYEMARTRVLGFGHRSKDDWDDANASGQLGQYVPSYPDEMYASEWVSWDEWLGIMRSYDETKNLATNVLCLKSLDDYLLFVKSNPKRAAGLRIPVRPDIKYKDEWVDEDTFFGKSSDFL